MPKFLNPINITTPGGSAPLIVNSSTLVANLNADLLDGQHGSYFENRDTTAIGFSGGTLTLTRAAGNLTVGLDGRYLPLTGGVLTGALTGTTAAFGGDVALNARVSFGNRQPVYSLFHGGAQDLAWKKIADITFGTALYTGITLRVDVIDANTNFGANADCKPMTFFVSCRRSGGVLNDIDSALVFGPVADYVRAVKTATGVYELQIRQIADWLNHIFIVEVVSSGSGTITYVTGTPTNGSTTGTIYLPTTGGYTQRFTNLAVTGATTLSGTLSVTGAATLSSTLAVTGSSRLGGGTSNPAGTAFSNTIAGVGGSNRVVNFDGVGSLPSVWWTNGATAIGAIDAVSGGGLSFWSNNGSAWQQQVSMTYGAFNVLTTLQQGGNQVLHAGNVSTYALPIGGGTVTGQLSVTATTDPAILLSGGSTADSTTHLYTSIGGTGKVRVQRDGVIKGLGLEIRSGANVNAGSAVFSVNNAGALNAVGAITQNGNQVLHAGNVASYALPIGGGTLAGTLYLTDSTCAIFNNASRVTIRSESVNDVANYAAYGLYLPKTGQTAGLYVESPIEARTGLRIGNGAASGTITVGATTAATADRLVQRDGSGNIAAVGGTFTGALAVTGAITQGGNQVVHAGNVSTYAIAALGTTLSIADWNTLTDLGCRRTAPDGADVNGPPVNQYGNLLVFGGNDGRTQLQAGHDGRLAWRTKWNASDWTSWVIALDTGNVGTYALPISGGTLNGNLVSGAGYQVRWSDGSAAAPGYSFYAETGTGMYRAGTNTLGFATGGVQRLSIDGSGNATLTGAMTASSFSGSGASLTGTAASLNIGGNAATATRLTNLTSTTTSTAGTDNSESCVSYINGISLFGQTDGALYSHVYSASWKHNIYGDYRTGQLAVRGKNNGTWQAWRVVLDASNYTSYSPSLTGSGASGSWGINITGSSASCTGNAATATNLSTGRTNWSTNGVISAVVGQLGWKHYNNNHTIFDASNSTAPDGSAINNTNAQVAWTGTYPTLMGWNGANTYGVRVDSARVADSASQLGGQGIAYFENRDVTAVGFASGTLTLTRAAGNLTVSLDGRYLTGNQTVTISGDASGSGTTAISLTLASTGVTAGSYGSSTVIPQITVDAKGRVTGLSNVSPSGTWGISITGSAAQLNGQAASYYENRDTTAVSISAGTLTLSRSAGNLTTTLGGRTVAWCDFNGNFASSQTPNASFNVSSITKNATGDYTVNFSSALANANYVVAGSAQLDTPSPGASNYNVMVAVPRRSGAKAAGSCRVVCEYPAGVALYDSISVGVAFIAA
jgi:hypothetical protein